MAQMTSADSTRTGLTLLTKVHLIVTGVLLVALVAVAGLAARGMIRIGARPKVDPASVNAPEESKEPTAPPTGGRYRIEKVDDLRELLDGAGKLNFFGNHVLETWVFKYSGGYLQCQIEGEVDGQTVLSDPLPNEWKQLLNQDDGIKQNRAAAFEKQGYIVLTSMPATISITEAMASYHLPLSGILSGMHFGPLHVLPALHLEVMHRRPYRLYVNAGPMPKSTGAGFNLWAEHMVTIRGPMIARSAGDEQVHVGGGKDLEPGKDVILLDRKRGYSRIRLKAKFLGDGEIRELAAK